MCTFGLRGAARNRKFDPQMIGREDIDFSLQSLMDDRIMLGDMRFYFDHGRIFSGRGGNAGKITRDESLLPVGKFGPEAPAAPADEPKAGGKS